MSLSNSRWLRLYGLRNVTKNVLLTCSGTEYFHSCSCSIAMRLNMLMLTKITRMLFRKTTFCLGETACWSRNLKSRVVKGLLTVSEIRDAMPHEFSCQSAVGERLAKRRLWNQQHEGSHTQDDTHFFPRYSRLYAAAFVLICAKILWYKKETAVLFGGTSHYLLCTLRVKFLLLNGAMAGLNKSDMRPPNASTTVITFFSVRVDCM
jgi:hypothetical protein